MIAFNITEPFLIIYQHLISRGKWISLNPDTISSLNLELAGASRADSAPTLIDPIASDGVGLWMKGEGIQFSTVYLQDVETVPNPILGEREIEERQNTSSKESFSLPPPQLKHIGNHFSWPTWQNWADDPVVYQPFIIGRYKFGALLHKLTKL